MTPVIFMSFILVLSKLLTERAKNMNKPHAWRWGWGWFFVLEAIFNVMGEFKWFLHYISRELTV